MDATVRYWAFLSYSHRDRRVAERLHRALETYRIPPRLVGRSGPLGPVPARLTPIFRDRDELAASQQLGAAVEAALAASGAMSVLCSRASAQSRWVDAEALAFERNHPGRPLLCVLVDGEPLASGDPATAGNDCLPPTLRPRFGSAAGVADTAPVAVDLRPQGDGWRLGVQKLVASLAGLPLDQLVQRDAHRRHRRMAWLSAALAALAATLGTLAVFALQARDDARLQRAQAEGLVEFMLGDLRRKLEPVGRLDVLDSVGLRALRTNQVLAGCPHEHVVIRKWTRRLRHESRGEERHQQEAAQDHPTRHKRSAARSSVASRLAKQKRRTGPAGSPALRNGEMGMAATPCSRASRSAKSASRSSVIAE